MNTTAPISPSRPLPRHVAVIGAAGGLGQGILGVCRAGGIDFTAIVRSRPERITDMPGRSRVVVVDHPFTTLRTAPCKDMCLKTPWA